MTMTVMDAQSDMQIGMAIAPFWSGLRKLGTNL